MPLNASEAMRGSPSPWKVLATMATLARKRERRLSCSERDSSEDVIAASGALYCRTMRLSMLWSGLVNNAACPLLPRRYGDDVAFSASRARPDAIGSVASRALSAHLSLTTTPVTREA